MLAKKSFISCETCSEKKKCTTYQEDQNTTAFTAIFVFALVAVLLVGTCTVYDNSNIVQTPVTIFHP